ncbi:MAG TPA: hypothetical protein VK866_04105 [Acidimicrobiales bacterium]|nr:hypothetical protein [Acidimicrobiales bacterium]
MLDRFDDYPIHQSPEPVAHPPGGVRNAYDRYFFNGYTADGSLFFAVAMGLYPNRKVIDASISVITDGVQRSVFASGRAPLERGTTRVGPIRVEVVEPMRTHRIVVEGDEGVRADLTFSARTPAVEEPRFTHRDGPHVVLDYTRLAQWGTWSGSIEVEGSTLEVGAGVLGCRDRSWGIRPVGERDPGAPGGIGQFFWLWAPINWDDRATHFAVNETRSGHRWHASGRWVPVLGADDDPVDRGVAEPAADVDWEIDWEPGTRRARHARVTLTPWRADPEVIELEPLLTFHMAGIGYTHPTWRHGVWQGEEAVGSDSWRLDEVDPLDPTKIHVQQLVRATSGDRVGVGVLEQLVIGPHDRAGFHDVLDGAAG